MANIVAINQQVCHMTEKDITTPQSRYRRSSQSPLQA